MPDSEGNTKADETATTPLHAYKEGREEDIKGDKETLLSDDPQEQQAQDIADDDEPSPAPEKA
jgi:hypothetical protein